MEKYPMKIETKETLKEDETFVELIDNRGLGLCFSPLGLVTIAKVLDGDEIEINKKKFEKHHFIPLKATIKESDGYLIEREEEYKNCGFLTMNDCDDTEQADSLVNSKNENKIWV